MVDRLGIALKTGTGSFKSNPALAVERDSRLAFARLVDRSALWFAILTPMILACDVGCHAVLRGWFAIWFAGPIPSAEPRGRSHGRFLVHNLTSELV
jgi:hypothetical protein